MIVSTEIVFLNYMLVSKNVPKPGLRIYHYVDLVQNGKYFIILVHEPIVYKHTIFAGIQYMYTMYIKKKICILVMNSINLYVFCR